MRITIEIDQYGQTASASRTLSASTHGESLDGGGPPTALLGQDSQQPMQQGTQPDANGGVDAGPPPEWLVSAIAASSSGAMSNGNGHSSDVLDAGSAPNFG